MTHRFWPTHRFSTRDNIWVGKDLETEEEVVMKLTEVELDAAYASKNDQTNLEAHCLRDLSELNPVRIVKYIAFYRNDESQFVLVMEKAQCSVADALELRVRLTEFETKTIIRCVLEALVTAHRKYIVHRDIKPDNLFLFTDELDSVKVGDWGICAEDNGYNCVGGMKGTKGYMAPETLKKMQYGRPVDIYACGVVAYQLIFGILPFPAEPVKKGLFTVKQKLSFPLTFNLSSEGRDFITSLLSEDPDSRPTAENALKHPWFSAATPAVIDDPLVGSPYSVPQPFVPVNPTPVSTPADTTNKMPVPEKVDGYKDWVHLIPVLGAPYYIHMPTRKTQWEHPVDMGILPDELAEAAAISATEPVPDKASQPATRPMAQPIAPKLPAKDDDDDDEEIPLARKARSKSPSVPLPSASIEQLQSPLTVASPHHVTFDVNLQYIPPPESATSSTSTTPVPPTNPSLDGPSGPAPPLSRSDTLAAVVGTRELLPILDDNAANDSNLSHQGSVWEHPASPAQEQVVPAYRVADVESAPGRHASVHPVVMESVVSAPVNQLRTTMTLEQVGTLERGGTAPHVFVREGELAQERVVQVEEGLARVTSKHAEIAIEVECKDGLLVSDIGEGWRMVTVPANTVYYFNVNTNATQWQSPLSGERPQEGRPPAPPAPPLKDDAAPGSPTPPKRQALRHSAPPLKQGSLAKRNASSSNTNPALFQPRVSSAPSAKRSAEPKRTGSTSAVAVSASTTRRTGSPLPAASTRSPPTTRRSPLSAPTSPVSSRARQTIEVAQQGIKNVLKKGLAGKQ